MSVARNKSPYDRRIRELQREAEILKRNIQSTSKQLEKTGVDPDILAERMRRLAHQPAVEAPVQQPEPEPAPEPVKTKPSVPSNRYATPMSKIPAGKNERFANYFSSGSFGKAGPLSRERKVQRNRALFMILVVVLAVFLLYRYLA